MHADINQAGEDWVQVTISGPSAGTLTEADIERLLTGLSAAEPVKLDISDGSPLVTDLIIEFERARRQWDEFNKTGISTAAIGSYDLCFGAVLAKHIKGPLYAAPPAPSVAVKALEWEIPTGCNDYYWNALSSVGQYRIRPKAGNGFELLLLMADTFPFYSSVEEAKAAAQAD